MPIFVLDIIQTSILSVARQLLKVTPALTEYTALPDSDLEISYAAMPKHISFWYFKTSPEIIQLAVMLYVRFPLSLRQV